MRRRHSHDDIFDERGLLKDGKTYRARMTMMDSAAPVQRSGRIKATDLRFGSAGALARPGYRLSASNFRPDLVIRQRAYDTYNDELENAWRNPTTDADEDACPDCGGTGTLDGEECERCGGTGEVDDDDDGTERETSDDRSSRRVTQRDPRGREVGTFTEEDTRRLARDHKNQMDQLYDARDAALREEWRNPSSRAEHNRKRWTRGLAPRSATRRSAPPMI